MLLKGSIFMAETDRNFLKEPARLAVLISNKGTGSNLQAITDAIDRKEILCSIEIVVSDKSNTQGLDRAKKHHIPWEVMILQNYKQQTARDKYGIELSQLLNGRAVEIAILAGFSTILAPTYFESFQGITINVHPGLFPDRKDEPFLFPDGTVAPWNRGLMTDDAVKNFLGLKYAGSTIHVVTEEADFGPVLKRVIVDVKPGDTVDTLYNERLKPAENRGFIEVLKNPFIKRLIGV